ncbi:hypothetical protein GCM10027271_20730 [Saccharopolyspora gloriosae]
MNWSATVGMRSPGTSGCWFLPSTRGGASPQLRRRPATCRARQADPWAFPARATAVTKASAGRSTTFTARSGERGNVSPSADDHSVVDVDEFLENPAGKEKR